MAQLARVSHSQMEMWNKCPRQWEFRYEFGIKLPPGSNFIIGGAYHEAVEHTLKQKKTTGEIITVEQALDKYSDVWDTRVREEEKIDWGDDNPGVLKDLGTRLVGTYVVDVAPMVKPQEVEVELRKELDGTMVVSRLDLILDTGDIVENKTSSKRYTQAQVDRDLQSSCYAWQLGHATQNGFHVALKQKNPEIQIMYTGRSMEDIQWWEQMGIKIIRQMRTGNAPPRPQTQPGDYHCSPEYCGYWNICMPKMSVRW